MSSKVIQENGEMKKIQIIHKTAILLQNKARSLRQICLAVATNDVQIPMTSEKTIEMNLYKENTKKFHAYIKHHS